MRLHALGWIVLGGALVAAVAFAVGGTRSLGHAGLEERESALAAQIGTGVNELHALEWQTRAERGVSSELEEKIVQTRGSIEASFNRLAALEGGDTMRNRRAYRAYARVTSRELGLLRDGKQAAALRLDDAEVDPRAEALAAVIDRQTQEIGAEARGVRTQARRMLAGALISTGVLVALLVWQFALQQRGRRVDRGLLARLRDLGRQKDEFVATVSHELRTPLTSIRGYAELLEDERGLSSEQVRWVHVITRNANRLQSLVTDLLLIAEVSAGKFALDVGKVDLTNVVADAVEAARPAAGEKGLAVTNQSPAHIELQGDAARLGQVLDNLLSNAIKFTPEGGSVVVRTAVRDGTAVLEVADSGIGIAAVDQERLFERFFRASYATKGAIQGTGLGLAITKTIVDAHRGSIRVMSSPGAGTTFRILLPVDEASPARPADADGAIPAAA